MVLGEPGARRTASRGLPASPCHVPWYRRRLRPAHQRRHRPPRSTSAAALARIVIASADAGPTNPPDNQSASRGIAESPKLVAQACASASIWTSGSSACAVGGWPPTGAASWLSGTAQWLGPRPWPAVTGRQDPALPDAAGLCSRPTGMPQGALHPLTETSYPN